MIELLVTIAIIGMLAGMILTGISRARERGKIQRARNMVHSIAATFRAMENDYGRFPYDPTPATGIALSNTFMWLVLGGWNASPTGTGWDGNPGWAEFQTVRPYNQRMTMYMEFNTNEVKYASSDIYYYRNVRLGTPVDPWGNPYRVAVGTMSTLTVVNPFKTTATVRQPLIVWSAGPDGKWTNDLVLGDQSPVNRDNIKSY